MTAFSDIKSQLKFVQAANELHSVIAYNRFCPRKYYDDINKYYKQNSDLPSDRKPVYWHREVGAENTNNIHNNYYQNDKGASIHVSIKIADNISERNSVHFGTDCKESARPFSVFISKLRRLATEANRDLQHAQDIYDDTPQGIHDALENQVRSISVELDSVVTSRQSSYRQLQKTTGSGTCCRIYQNSQTHEIGRITTIYGNCGWKTCEPVEPSLDVFFENEDIYSKLTELLVPLRPMQERFRIEVVEAWQAEKIVNRLKGEFLPVDS